MKVENFATTHYILKDVEIDAGGTKYYKAPEWLLRQGLMYIRDIKNTQDNKAVYFVSKEELQLYFYELRATNVDFAQQFLSAKNLERNFTTEHVQMSATPGLSDTEMSFLYNFVQQIEPKKILEFSCGSGWSTVTTAKALEHKNITPDYFETHELELKRISETKRNLRDNNITFVKIKHGNVFNTLDREKLKDLDFIFIDSDHTKKFTDRYIEEFLPLLKKGAWVAIHDIRLHPIYATGETFSVADYVNQTQKKNFFHIHDVLKLYGQTCLNDEFESCCRHTLFFFQV